MNKIMIKKTKRRKRKRDIETMVKVKGLTLIQKRRVHIDRKILRVNTSASVHMIWFRTNKIKFVSLVILEIIYVIIEAGGSLSNLYL